MLRLFPQTELVGVDVSGVMLDKARRNLAGMRAELLKGELDELELADGTFDKIICTEVLEHVVEPVLILRHIHRLLRSDGRAVITFPNDQLIDGLKRAIVRVGLTRLPPFRRISWGGEDYHFHVWSVGEMRAMLARHFVIEGEAFAPTRLLPVRCCFACRRRAR